MKPSEGAEAMSEGADRTTFEQAVEHHRAGRIEMAEQLYREVCTSDSRYADALHLSGVAALQLGRHDDALQLIEQAIQRAARVGGLPAESRPGPRRGFAAGRFDCRLPARGPARSGAARRLVWTGDRPSSRQSTSGSGRRLSAVGPNPARPRRRLSQSGERSGTLRPDG